MGMALSEGQSVFDISELFLLDQAGEAAGNFVVCADYLAAWSGSNDGWASHLVSVVIVCSPVEGMMRRLWP